MKKLLALVLVMVLSVTALTGCSIETVKGTVVDTFNNVKNTVLGWFGVEVEPDVNPNLEAAASNLYYLYKDVDAKTRTDYTLVSSVTVEGQNFPVAWFVSVDSITITDNGNGTVTVDVPEEPENDISYTLTAIISDEYGNTVEKTFNRLVPGVNVTYTEVDYAGYLAALDDQGIIVNGVVSAIFSKSVNAAYNAVYVQDLNGAGGYYVYSLADSKDPVADLGLKLGMTVKVQGLKANYDAGFGDPIVHEIVSAEITVTDSTEKEVTPIDLTAAYTSASTLKDDALIAKVGALVTIKGVTIGGQKTSSGYYYFSIGDLQSYVRISSSSNAISKTDVETFTANHTANNGFVADVTGIVNLYSGSFYLVPATVDAFHNVQVEERSDADKVALVKDALTLTDSIIADTVITLPESILSEVNVEWSATGAQIADGKIDVKLGSEAYTITVTANISCGEASDTKVFEISVAAGLDIPDGAIRADLETITAGSYGQHTTTDGWVIENGMAAGSEYLANTGIAHALVIRGATSGVGSITSPALTGPLAAISFNYANLYSESNGVDITIYVKQNGAVVASKNLDNNSVTKGATYFFEWVLDTAIEGEYVIYIENNCPTNSSSNKDRVGIFNLLCYSKVIEATDDTKVAAEKEALELSKTEYTIDSTVTLPTAQRYEDVTIEWASDNECVKIEDGKLVITMPTADVKVTITATLKSGSCEDTKTFELTLDVPAYTLTDVAAPEAGVAYKLYLVQKSLGKNLFFNGKMDGYYFGATASLAEAADVYAVAADGGYYLTFVDSEGETKYIEAYLSGTYINARLADAPSYVWNYSAEMNAWVSVLDESNTAYLGTYSSNGNIRVSNVSYITGDNAANVGVSQFVAYLATYTCAHEYEFSCSTACLECGDTRADVTHDFGDYACNDTCKNCGEKRDAGHVDAGLDGKCDYCGESMEAIEKERIEEENGLISLPEEVTSSQQLVLPLAGSKYDGVTISWKSGSAAVVISDNGVATIDLSNEAAEVVLTATISYGGSSVDYQHTVKLAAAPKFDLMHVIYPVEGTAYKLYLNQVTNGKKLYVTGEVDGRYLVTTDCAAKAADVYVKVVEGGYSFYVLEDGVEKYIYVYYNSSNKLSVGIDAVSDSVVASVFTYNEVGVWQTTLNGTEYYIGTYSNYETISASSLSYVTGDNAANVGVSQFPLGFCVYTCEHEYKEVCSTVCLECGAVRTDVTHTYDNNADCDPDCNVCGETREASEHVDTDGNAACDNCGASLTALYESYIAAEKKAVSFDNEYATGLTLTLPVVGATYDKVTITWTAEGATVAEDGKSVTLDKEAAITLTAIFTCGNSTETVTYTFNAYELKKVLNPITNVKFKIYVPDMGIYFAGTASSGKLKSVTSLTAAADVYLVPAKDSEGNVVEGRYYLCMGEGEGVQYITMTANSTTGMAVSSTPDSEWTITEDGYICEMTKSGGARAIYGYNSVDFRGYAPGGSNGKPAYFVVYKCAHSYEYGCSASCQICGDANLAPSAHEYVYSCDTVCKNCGLETREADHVDEVGDDAKCDYCGTSMTDVELARIDEEKAALKVVDGTSYTASQEIILTVGNIYDKTVIEWNSSDDTAVKVSGNYALITLGETEKTVTLTAKISYGSSSDTVTYTLTVGARASFELTTYIDLKEGVAYKLYLNQVKNGKKLYVTGEVNGRYLVTTDCAAEAADVYVKVVEGGYSFYVLEDGVEKYIYVYYNSSNKLSVGIDAVSDSVVASVFTYNEVGVWQTTLNGTEYYIGTYDSYETISASSLSYVTGDNAAKVGVSQFPVQMVTYSCTHVYENKACETVCDLCGEAAFTAETAHSRILCDDTACSVCGETIVALEHKYDDACDADCNECGATREAPHVYDNACDGTCNNCDVTRTPADHVYDNDCTDADCNECGATREVTGHVDAEVDNVCDKCGNTELDNVGETPGKDVETDPDESAAA